MKKFEILFILLLIIAVSAYSGFEVGYRRGIGAGVVGTLDTVNTMLEKQVRSDTSITELTIANPDTTRYFLSRKTLLPK